MELGKFDLYKLPLKSLTEGESHEFDYTLGNQFFTDIDGSEFNQGDVEVMLDIKRTGSTFELQFDIVGSVKVPCDRCLENMEIEIDAEEMIYVKFGREFNDEDDSVIIVPEEEGELNIAWLMYEFIALSIPLKHTHPLGECNPEMSSVLSQHVAHDPDEIYSDDDQETTTKETTETDPRWDKLKKLIDNN